MTTNGGNIGLHPEVNYVAPLQWCECGNALHEDEDVCEQCKAELEFHETEYAPEEGVGRSGAQSSAVGVRLQSLPAVEDFRLPPNASNTL